MNVLELIEKLSNLSEEDKLLEVMREDTDFPSEVSEIKKDNYYGNVYIFLD